MNFDPVAFALGPQGVAVATQGNSDGGGASVAAAVVSSLINEGGGGGVTLETSGWVSEINANATVTGNVVDLPTGSTSTSIKIQPPESVNPNRKFAKDDVFKIKIKVTVISGNARLLVGLTSTQGTLTGETGAFTIDPAWLYAYATSVCEDELTWTFSRDNDYVKVNMNTNTGSTSAYTSGTCEIVGMSLNGETIYGKV